MVKKFNEFINETIFGDMLKRSYKDDVRKEDDPNILFINSREDPDNYYIEDGLVCCKGDVLIYDEDIVDGHFPVKFGKVDGFFDCDNCESLDSLKGSPEEVSIFVCNNNKSLTSLEGAPKRVRNAFSCFNCTNLISLEGGPEEVLGDFDCGDCEKLESLEGAPEKVGGDFICCGCNSIETLEGAPEYVGGDFNCSGCKSLVSLDDKPKEIGGKFIYHKNYIAY